MTLKQQMGKRLAQVRADAGMSQGDFAASLKVSGQLYALFEAGKTEMPADFMRSLHDRSVNVTWLMVGEGDRYDLPSRASA